LAGGGVDLVGLVKRFEDVTAVDGIDLAIPGGEFFSLLGPSGCGKTTTLRLIAGFEQPTAGRILLDGDDMAQTPPHRRKVNTVFQSYALFPFMTVQENVAFGLRYKDVSKAEARRLVGEALALVRLEGMERRRPRQLSGGQQQRVALARALVLEPSVLLLDEPLGALDAKLRQALQVELKALQEAVGVTFVYVTHDQEEALTMSDRLAVLSGGRIQQVGTPAEVYEEPAGAFVADFLGVSNLMAAEARGTVAGGHCELRLGRFEVRAERGDLGARGPVKLVIRPERVRLEPYGTGGENRLPGMVERVVYQGASVRLFVRLAAGETVQVALTNQGGPMPFEQGTAVVAHLPPAALRVLADEPNGSAPKPAEAEQAE
jgi:spermidine/putrescine transport system ATP-binding protein